MLIFFIQLTPLDGLVKIGESLTVIITITDHSNIYDARINDCWAYNSEDYYSKNTKKSLINWFWRLSKVRNSFWINAIEYFKTANSLEENKEKKIKRARERKNKMTKINILYVMRIIQFLLRHKNMCIMITTYFSEKRTSYRFGIRRKYHLEK